MERGRRREAIESVQRTQRSSRVMRPAALNELGRITLDLDDVEVARVAFAQAEVAARPQPMGSTKGHTLVQARGRSSGATSSLSSPLSSRRRVQVELLSLRPVALLDPERSTPGSDP
jgi:hypothetical protein